jgi:hypothetical protein
MTIHQEIENLRIALDAAKNLDEYLEIQWQINFLEQTLAVELQDFDFNSGV